LLRAEVEAVSDAENGTVFRVKFPLIEPPG